MKNIVLIKRENNKTEYNPKNCFIFITTMP